MYSITFQVWRPGDNVEVDGCYSLEEEDSYENIQLSVRDVHMSLVNRTLEPENFLSVQPGDVVGYFTTIRGAAGMLGGIQLGPCEADEGEEVWYFTDTDVSGTRYCTGISSGGSSEDTVCDREQ